MMTAILDSRGACMISKELVDILRCPLDPGHTTHLDQEADGLSCQRCRLKFPIKEGIPCMLVEEAELPAGAASLQALPCQQTPVSQGVQG
jgi:uncharacterized protein